MSRDIWVISDTHFLHANSLKWEDGPRGKLFDSVDHMNETMIERWNKRVKPGDKVYHLGDVFMGNKDKFKSLWPRLNGKKRLVVGNHDDIKWLSQGNFFQKIYMWRIFSEFGLTLTHLPMREDQMRRSSCNVHGHIHHQRSPTEQHKCVCVEQTDYYPVNIETLRVK